MHLNMRALWTIHGISKCTCSFQLFDVWACVCVPAGVDQCITIAAQAKAPGLNPEQDMADFIDLLNAGMAANASVDNHHTSEHLELHRIILKDLIFGMAL